MIFDENGINCYPEFLFLFPEYLYIPNITVYYCTCNAYILFSISRANFYRDHSETFSFSQN